MPARPPITTNSTPCFSSAERMTLGWNLGAMRRTDVPAHELRDGDPVIDPLGWRHREVLAQERAVVSVVDLTGGERQLLAEEVEQGRQGRNGGGDDAALDAGDRGLRGAGAGGELLLPHAVATARSAQELAGSHIVSISLMTYGALYEPRWYARGACACAPPPSPRASAGRAERELQGGLHA